MLKLELLESQCIQANLQVGLKDLKSELARKKEVCDKGLQVEVRTDTGTDQAAMEQLHDIENAEIVVNQATNSTGDVQDVGGCIGENEDLYSRKQMENVVREVCCRWYM